ncbi:MAG: DUF86 domain-containing protein [Candidatus Geothermarchaeales archaeon]
MPKRRNIEIYLEDILEASEKIGVYTKDMDFEEFVQDEKTKDAVLRNLEVIGEAAKNLPDDFKDAHREVKWKAIAGMRDKLIHEYFGVSTEIVWETVNSDVPKLKLQIGNILRSIEAEEPGG